jgi:hypothetical protein
MIRRILRKLRGNEFERILARASARGARRCLVYWNRGLGDIPLGLYALFERVREALRARRSRVTRGTWPAFERSASSA